MKSNKIYFFLYLIGVISCLFFISFFCTAGKAETAQEEVIIITDIQSWHHPTKDIFKKNAVEVSKIELRSNKRYAIFYVKFPYDPQSSATKKYFNKLYLNILRANGWRDFSLQDNDDQITIKVRWDKHKKEAKIEIVCLRSQCSAGAAQFRPA
jgi:hypothetical protein